jgi:2-polyprenyl-6-methoxyphenol hydroxylase-like FAD-dependent oxidoreductase
MLPSTGAGAVNAMQDAVILANCIYDIVPNNFDTVKEALDEFKIQRFEFIKAQYAQTYIAAKIQYGHVSLLLFFYYRKHVLHQGAGLN